MVLGPMFVALALAAQPVAAATPINQSGDYGDYEITDFEDTQRGANCLYEGHKTNGRNRLDKISIRPPRVHSYAGQPATRTSGSAGATSSSGTPTSTTSTAPSARAPS